AGSETYLKAVEQVASRADLEGLKRAIETLKLGWSDLTEEAAKNKQQ
ncbi:MAG: hypothetical protein F6K26_55835, partial [Moorea sp. SIO2I5]|nr:hypothetical protein [Moorena sp. SIO2I5]NEQ88841.1 hypothetical protein [Moorena sp. SIO2I5]